MPIRLLLHRYCTRAVWLKMHRYLALTVGLFFVIIGLTGSLCVYRDDIDLLLNPQLHIEETSAPLLQLDKIIAAVRAAQPNRHGVWTLEMPRTANAAFTAWFEQPSETFGAFYAPLMVSVNPYTGHVISSRFWGQTFSTWIVDLHSHLLWEATGRKAMAVLAVLLMISVISGLYLWWPGLARLTSGFSVKHDVGLKRCLFDLHRLLGFVSALGLLLLAFTGFHLAYPPLLQALTNSSGMGHGDEGPNVRSTAIPNDRPISLQEAVLIARGPFPSSEVRRISTPRGEAGTYRINLKQKQEINQHHPLANVWIDRWSGQIRDVQNPSQFDFAQRFTAWLWPLHTGEALEANGRWLWFLLGLMPLVLYASGIWLCLQRHGVVKDRSLDLPGFFQSCLSSLQRSLLYSFNLLAKLWQILSEMLKSRY